MCRKIKKKKKKVSFLARGSRRVRYIPRKRESDSDAIFRAVDVYTFKKKGEAKFSSFFLSGFPLSREKFNAGSSLCAQNICSTKPTKKKRCGKFFTSPTLRFHRRKSALVLFFLEDNGGQNSRYGNTCQLERDRESL